MRGKLPFEEGAVDDPAPPLGEEDDLRFARGLSLALLAVTPFWALVGFGVWWLVG